MKIKPMVCAIMALSLASGGLAFGQGRNDRDDRGGNDRGRNEQMQRNDHRDNGNNRNNGRGPQRPDNAQRDERGAGPNHNFHRGDRLPAEYRHRQYVVDDWRGHNLSAPPRGYHWVQNGADYLLVGIATGVIMQLFLGR